jgi:hypothetical protein
MWLTKLARLVFPFAVVAAACFAAGFFLTRFLIDHHYVAF